MNCNVTFNVNVQMYLTEYYAEDEKRYPKTTEAHKCAMEEALRESSEVDKERKEENQVLDAAFYKDNSRFKRRITTVDQAIALTIKDLCKYCAKSEANKKTEVEKFDVNGEYFRDLEADCQVIIKSLVFKNGKFCRD